MKELLLIVGLLAPGLVPLQDRVGVTVSGRVIGPPSQNLSGTQRASLNGSSSQATSINADGSFTFSNVRPGTYNLTINSGILSQPISIVVDDKDITGIEAVVVTMADVTGTVVVDGGGIRPRITLSFSSFRGGTTTPSAALSSDGSFRAVLREGEYQLTWSALPSGYQLKSITAGSLDLLTNPLKITGGIPVPPIVMTLKVDSPPPWVKVSGRVIGLNRGQGAGPRLTLSGVSFPLQEVPDTAINADGSFEFLRVLPGTYTARVTPTIPVPSTTIVVPSGKDLSGVEIIIPALKEVTGRVVVEGLSQIVPRLTFTLTPSDTLGRAFPLGNLSSAGIAQPDGTFKVTLPEAEHRVTLTVPGYSVRSLTYGSTDLLRDPLKISNGQSQELHVTLVPSSTGGSAGVVGGVLGGVTGGVLGGVLVAPGEIPQVINNVVPSPPSPPPAPTRVRVGGNVIAANLISPVKPEYPLPAKEAGIQGVVVLEAEISKEGAVENLKVITGHPLLTPAAIEAVKQWRYKPVILNNEPVPVVTTITVNFAISRE
jgi:TonB family protein